MRHHTTSGQLRAARRPKTRLPEESAPGRATNPFADSDDGVGSGTNGYTRKGLAHALQSVRGNGYDARSSGWDDGASGPG
ncbi:hypothetical protein GCM10009610_03870 [Pseudonocardia xinjiangensis]